MRLTLEVELPENKVELFRQILDNLSFVKTISQATQYPENIPEWQTELIGQRLAAYEADPGNVISWDALQQEIREKHNFE